jgi:uncharacterized protein YdaU (DUF1376 family)
MHYYEFNVADYRADTAHLSLLEHGIYRQLMDWYYLDEKPIPLATQVVMRRLAMGSEGLHNLENVLTDFFHKTEKGYCHKRIEQEIAHYRAKAAKNRVNGQLGGRPRKTQVVDDGGAVINPQQSEVNPNHEPQTSNHSEKILCETSRQADDFSYFWQCYPKKTGKGAALKAWNKLKPPVKQILAALQWQKVSKPWVEGFIPLPTTYLNQERWNDEPESQLGGGAAQEFYQAKPVKRSDNFGQRLSQSVAQVGIKKASEEKHGNRE